MDPMDVDSSNNGQVAHTSQATMISIQLWRAETLFCSPGLNVLPGVDTQPAYSDVSTCWGCKGKRKVMGYSFTTKYWIWVAQGHIAGLANQTNKMRFRKQWYWYFLYVLFVECDGTRWKLIHCLRKHHRKQVRTWSHMITPMRIRTWPFTTALSSIATKPLKRQPANAEYRWVFSVDLVSALL